MTETLTDVDDTDDLVLTENAQAQAESQQHILEQAARGVGLLMNTYKTELMCFKQDSAIASLNRKSLDSLNFLDEA